MTRDTNAVRITGKALSLRIAALSIMLGLGACSAFAPLGADGPSAIGAIDAAEAGAQKRPFSALPGMAKSYGVAPATIEVDARYAFEDQIVGPCLDVKQMASRSGIAPDYPSGKQRYFSGTCRI